MATPLTADQMLKALKAEGVNVKEHAGWRTHNRNHKGAWGPMHGIVIHHTAGRDSLGVVWNGTGPDLPGPLCHTHLSKSGVATMIGNGRANHAGTFAQNAYNAMLNESKTHPRPSASEPVDGNAHTYGIEIENLGTGKDPYPAVQYDQAVRWAAAICRAHGWGKDSVIGHREGTTRKIDPSFSMDNFRAKVAERLAHLASWNPDDEETTDMPETIGLYEAIDLKLTAREWTTLKVDGKTDLLTGASAYTAGMHLVLEAGPYACTIQGRFYHLRPDGSRWNGPLMEMETTEGKTFFGAFNSGSIAADEKLRFEAIFYPLDPTDEAGRKVLTAQVRGLSWT